MRNRSNSRRSSSPRKSSNQKSSTRPKTSSKSDGRKSFDKDSSRSSDRKSFGKKGFKSSRGEKSFDRDSPRFSDKKPFGKKGFKSSRAEKSFDKDSPRSFDKKPFGKKEFKSSRGEKSFDKDSPRSFDKKSFGKKGFKSSGDEKSFDRDSPRFSDKKPFGKKGFKSARVEKSFDRDSPRSFDKKSFDKKGFKSARGEKSFDRDSPKSFDKKPFGKKEFKSSRGEKSFDRDSPRFSDKKPFGKKSFKSSDSEKRFDKPNKSVERGSFRKKPFSAQSKRYRKSEDVRDSLQSGTEQIRLNKYIANSGVCSRREADELITMGLVSVNNKTITELGFKVNPGDVVKYEGKTLRAEKPVYILLNKPKGYLTTTKDPQERNTVMHIVGKAIKERIYPVGRLDRNTTGLLLLTNDGDLAEKLSHPSYNVKKIYKVELDRPLTKADFQKVLEGIKLEEGRALVDDLAIVSEDGKTIGLEIHIGWNRVVRRIFEALEYDVIKLDRSVYAGLDKKDLPRGHWRHLSKQELIQLKHYSK